jgi:response regulator RpfG family c-di-GMP phosphodiesterase
VRIREDSKVGIVKINIDDTTITLNKNINKDDLVIKCEEIIRNLKNENIVLYDDSSYWRKALLDLFDKDGVADRVILSETSEETIRKITELKPEIVIFDLFSPNPKKAAGQEITQFLRNKELRKEAKIVLFTTLKKEELPKGILELVNSYIWKYDPDFASKFELLLRRK